MGPGFLMSIAYLVRCIYTFLAVDILNPSKCQSADYHVLFGNNKNKKRALQVHSRTQATWRATCKLACTRAMTCCGSSCGAPPWFGSDTSIFAAWPVPLKGQFYSMDWCRWRRHQDLQQRTQQALKCCPLARLKMCVITDAEKG